MERTTLYEYEQILIGAKKNFSASFFCFSNNKNEKLSLLIFKYAIENYLKWTPEEAKVYLNMEIIKLMHLDKILKHIHFPSELDASKDFFYIVHLLYPKRIKYHKKDLVLKVYKSVLSGETCKFPKNFLSEMEGVIRANLCFQYMISQYLTFSSVEEMYYYFASPLAYKTLKQYHLNQITVELFEHPLDCLHSSLPKSQKNEFLYQFLKFSLVAKEHKRATKKRG